MTKQVFIPEILTANTYFWKPGVAAAQRRANEDKRQAEVADWLREMGFNVDCSKIDKVAGILEDKHGCVRVEFYYSESARNVYKHFRVWRNGKRSNIKGLKAEMKKRGIELI